MKKNIFIIALITFIISACNKTPDIKITEDNFEDKLRGTYKIRHMSGGYFKNHDPEWAANFALFIAHIIPPEYTFNDNDSCSTNWLWTENRMAFKTRKDTLIFGDEPNAGKFKISALKGNLDVLKLESINLDSNNVNMYLVKAW